MKKGFLIIFLMGVFLMANSAFADGKSVGESAKDAGQSVSNSTKDVGNDIKKRFSGVWERREGRGPAGGQGRVSLW
jgi:hypothetical protein